jgi:hypothetical protein
MNIPGLINALGLLVLAFALGFFCALQMIQPAQPFPF